MVHQTVEGRLLALAGTVAATAAMATTCTRGAIPIPIACYVTDTVANRCYTDTASHSHCHRTRPAHLLPMPPHTRADSQRLRAHLAVTRALFQRNPECLFNLVAAFRAGVQGKLQLSFDGTLKGSSLHWEQLPVMSVPAMGDLPRGAMAVGHSAADARATVLLEVLTHDDVFVYAVPLRTFLGAADAAELDRRIVEFEGLFGPQLQIFSSRMTVAAAGRD